MHFGLNLFSVRNLIQTESDFAKTADCLRRMGYESIQYSGGPYDADMIQRVSAQSGLRVVLTHVPLTRILEDTDNLMEEHARFGCQNIGLGAMPWELLADREGFTETVSRLNTVGAYMEAHGFRFFYHHHQFEFSKFVFPEDGEMTLFDYMVKKAPHIHFTADTHWLQYGGTDICATIDRLAGRVECLHLKDYGVLLQGEKQYQPTIVPVGSGNIDFARVIAHARAAGTVHFLVEQDNAAEAADPLAEAERSIRYLRAHFENE